MKKNLINDYLSYILVKLFGPFIRRIPLGISYFFAKLLGDFFYVFDHKRRRRVYAHLRYALGENLSCLEIRRINRQFFQNFMQNFLEVFMIPLINAQYINRYINIEGLDYIKEGLKKGKGVILLGMHEGSWELSNVICANLGFPLNFFIRSQGMPRLNALLNAYRQQKGCKLIQRENQIRQIITALKNNEVIGMTIDQGGKRGVWVKFFGKEASMASAAVRLALKYDATIIAGFYVRIKGPYLKIILHPPFAIKKTGNQDKDIHDNLSALISIFEKDILDYPQEYYWNYKIWKYSQEKNILILDDGKTGHLRQSQLVANIIEDCLKEKGIKTKKEILGIKFKNKFCSLALVFSSGISSGLESIFKVKYSCQGCLFCLSHFLDKKSYQDLLKTKPDIIISCGSSLAPVNFIFRSETLAKSIVILKPSILSTKRFDLVIMPKHDNPPKRKNIVITEGALNLINPQYLKEKENELIKALDGKLKIDLSYLGLLVGGDTKNFRLDKETIYEVIRQIKSLAEELNFQILVTTSRRTPFEIEQLLKKEFKDYPPCRLLIIANERNLPSALGGILSLSKIIIVSAESISMISEAASAKKYVLVFEASGLDKKHKRFLEFFRENKYIYLVKPKELKITAQRILSEKPPFSKPEDNSLVRQAIEKIQ